MVVQVESRVNQGEGYLTPDLVDAWNSANRQVPQTATGIVAATAPLLLPQLIDGSLSVASLSRLSLRPDVAEAFTASANEVHRKLGIDYVIVPADLRKIWRDSMSKFAGCLSVQGEFFAEAGGDRDLLAALRGGYTRDTGLDQFLQNGEYEGQISAVLRLWQETRRVLNSPVCKRIYPVIVRTLVDMRRRRSREPDNRADTILRPAWAAIRHITEAHLQESCGCIYTDVTINRFLNKLITGNAPQDASSGYIENYSGQE